MVQLTRYASSQRLILFLAGLVVELSVVLTELACLYPIFIVIGVFWVRDRESWHVERRLNRMRYLTLPYQLCAVVLRPS